MNLLFPLALVLLLRLRAAPRPQAQTKTARKQPVTTSGPQTYLNKLAILESGPTQPNWDARRPRSQYWGRWQLGRLARNGPANEPKAKWPARRVSWDVFKASPEIQTAAVTSWSKRAFRELQNSSLAKAAIQAGQAHGLPVTWSGLVGMDHLVGRGAVIKWLRTGEDTKDANGTPGTRYLKTLNGADLSAWNIKPKTEAAPNA